MQELSVLWTQSNQAGKWLRKFIPLKVSPANFKGHFYGVFRLGHNGEFCMV